MLNSTHKQSLRSLGSLSERIDHEILSLLGVRREVTALIGVVKADSGLPIKNKKSETQILSRATKIAKKHGLDPKTISSIYQSVLKDAFFLQKGIKKTLDSLRTSSVKTPRKTTKRSRRR